MLAGSLLWIELSDVVFMLVVFAATGLCFAFLHKPLLRASEGYREGRAGGAHAAWWDFVFYALVGIVITTAVRIAGVLVVFGFLIMPATISTLFASHWGVRLLIAWLVAAVASIAGLVGAYYLDFSVGPVIALCMGVFLAALAVLARLRSILAPAPAPIAGVNVACSPKEG